VVSRKKTRGGERREETLPKKSFELQEIPPEKNNSSQTKKVESLRLRPRSEGGNQRLRLSLKVMCGAGEQRRGRQRRED